MIDAGKSGRSSKTAQGGFTLVEILVGLSLLTLVFLLLAGFSFATARRQARIIRQNQASEIIEEEFERCRALSAQGYFTEIVDGERGEGIFGIKREVTDFTMDINNNLVAADERSVRIKRVTVTVICLDDPGFSPITRSTMILVR